MLAAAACLLLMFSVYTPDVLQAPDSMDSLYASLGAGPIPGAHKLDEFQNKASRGGDSRDSAHYKAFDAGWNSGRAELTVRSKDEEYTAEKNNQVYYWLGRWAVAATFARLQGKAATAETWNELRASLAELRTDMEEFNQTDVKVRATLDALYQFLERPLKELGSLTANEELRHLLDQLEQQVAE